MKIRSKVLGAAAAMAVTTVALSGCAGFGGGGSDAGSGLKGTITFTTWASPAEQKSFQSLIKTFESEHKGATVKLNVVPYANMFSGIDSALSAGNAPDVWRVDYPDLGVYSSQDQLLSLDGDFSKSEADNFNPALWEAVKYDGKVYGVPQEVDVSALLVNTDMVKAAGLDPSTFPKTQADAWTWEQFADVVKKLRTALPANQYPFVYNWQQGGAFRWLSWLFQADGSIIGTDGKTPEIDSAAGTKALDFTKSFFTNKWVPPQSSVKSNTYADSLFENKTAAMAFLGSFEVADIQSLAKFNWTAIPMPKDKRAATDLGGNALVATKTTKNPALSRAFLKYMVSEGAMKAFTAATNELPTLKTLSGDAVKFAVRPDVMPVFVDQAATIQPSDVKQITSPAMSTISTALQNQLDAAFVSGQSTSTTLSNLSSAVKQATSK